MSITLELPEEHLLGGHVSPQDVPRCVRIEPACSLYARGALTHVQAGTLSGLDRFEMGDELARRNVPRHYTDADLAADLAYDRGQ